MTFFELIVLIPQIAAPSRTMYLCHPISIFRTSAAFQNRNLWPKRAGIKQMNNEGHAAPSIAQVLAGLHCFWSIAFIPDSRLLGAEPPFSLLEIEQAQSLS